MKKTTRSKSYWLSFLLWFTSPFVKAQPETRDDIDLIATAIVLEAGGEGWQGMQLVASVIANRARQRDLTPTEVVMQRRQFACFNNTTKKRAKEIAQKHPEYGSALSMAHDVFAIYDQTGNATHFHAADKPAPTWAKRMHRTLRYGNHIFYREK